jgi:hypothetical protein
MLLKMALYRDLDYHAENVAQKRRACYNKA